MAILLLRRIVYFWKLRSFESKSSYLKSEGFCDEMRYTSIFENYYFICWNSNLQYSLSLTTFALLLTLKMYVLEVIKGSKNTEIKRTISAVSALYLSFFNCVLSWNPSSVNCTNALPWSIEFHQPQFVAFDNSFVKVWWCQYNYIISRAIHGMAWCHCHGKHQ